MNHLADPTRSARTVAAFVATAGSILLASACGARTASTLSVHKNAALAFSRCMRSHGVPSFPDPDTQGDFPSFQAGVSKQISSTANATCNHLLPSGGGGGAGTQGDRQKLAFALNVARCMRAHGFPTYPDPTTSSPSSQGSGTRFENTGIDSKSPQFETKETNCETHARKALGLP